MSILVSPTEPARITLLGTRSSIPERVGCDLLWGSPLGPVGVQRKEVSDLIASMHDGRLAKELGQMEGRLGIGMLVVEGPMQFTTDDYLIGSWTRITRSQIRRLMWSVERRGVWTERSAGMDDTCLLVGDLYGWTTKEKHDSLVGRPSPNGDAWGRRDSKTWQVHLLTGFDGIGSTTAEAMVETFGGMPLRWTVTEKELQQVPGIGKVRARKLVEALDQDPQQAEVGT